jgi:hypothetical protein
LRKRSEREIEIGRDIERKIEDENEYNDIRERQKNHKKL